MKLVLSLLLITLSVFPASGQDAMPAGALAAKLSSLQQDGTSLVRLKMDIQGKSALQIQIKQKRSAGSTEIVYQVLWPKDRAGEAVLLKQTGGQATASSFTPPDKVQPLGMGEGLFGSSLTPADVLENFFAWPNQTVVGNEAVGRVSCQILESKPGKGQKSPHASVRSWVDTRRLVPLRIEKYNSAGQVVCRIDSGRIVTDDIDRHIPASFTVGRGGSSTELDGSKLKHGVTFPANAFTPEGLKQAGSEGSPE